MASAPTSWRSSGSGSRWRGGPRSRTGSSPTASRSTRYGQHDPAKSLAARFGAKEAVMKALGVGLGEFAFRDVEVRARRQRRAVARALRRGAPTRRRAGRDRVAAVAHPHRHHRDGRRARARLRRARRGARPHPRGDGRGRSAHDRGGHAGRGAHGARRAGGRVGGARGSRAARYGTPCRRRVRQGQQRWRRAVAARALRGWGVRVARVRARADVDRPRASTRALATADVVVDAMFGTGFRGAARGRRRRGRRTRCATWDGPTVAVDIPSGVDGLTRTARRPGGARRRAR